MLSPDGPVMPRAATSAVTSSIPNEADSVPPDVEGLGEALQHIRHYSQEVTANANAVKIRQRRAFAADSRVRRMLSRVTSTVLSQDGISSSLADQTVQLERLEQMRKGREYHEKTTSKAKAKHRKTEQKLLQALARYVPSNTAHHPRLDIAVQGGPSSSIEHHNSFDGDAEIEELKHDIGQLGEEEEILQEQYTEERQRFHEFPRKSDPSLRALASYWHEKIKSAHRVVKEAEEKLRNRRAFRKQKRAGFAPDLPPYYPPTEEALASIAQIVEHSPRGAADHEDSTPSTPLVEHSREVASGWLRRANFVLSRPDTWPIKVNQLDIVPPRPHIHNGPRPLHCASDSDSALFCVPTRSSTFPGTSSCPAKANGVPSTTACWVSGKNSLFGGQRLFICREH